MHFVEDNLLGLNVLYLKFLFLVLEVHHILMKIGLITQEVHHILRKIGLMEGWRKTWGGRSGRLEL